MWSRAVYDFRISTKQFYRLTPRQYHLLHDRYMDDLLHREMVAAFTTAAVLNSGFHRAEEGVTPLDYMPNHPQRYRKAPPVSAENATEAKAAMSSFDANAQQLSIELKAYATTGTPGTLMLKMGLVAKPE